MISVEVLIHREALLPHNYVSRLWERWTEIEELALLFRFENEGLVKPHTAYAISIRNGGNFRFVYYPETREGGLPIEDSHSFQKAAGVPARVLPSLLAVIPIRLVLETGSH